MLFAAGDTLAQQAVEKKGFANHDLPRSGRMALYGGGKHALSLLEDIQADLGSDIWAGCHQMVSILAEKDQSPEPQRHHRSSSSGRSDVLCYDQSRVLPFDHGYPRRR